ncbi:MAG: cupin domain-containing protein [Dehalococcoidia bacterium]
MADQADDLYAHTYLQTHKLQAPVLLFDLGREGAEVDERAAGDEKRRAARTLLKEGPLRASLLALKQGEALDEHAVGGPTTLHLLRGRLQLRIGEEELELRQGSLAALDHRIAHSAAALEDCILLVTVAMSKP